MDEKEQLIRLCQLAADEKDLQKLRRLIMDISILLEAKEQRLKNGTPRPQQADTHQHQ
jgi:hypothetical protein